MNRALIRNKDTTKQFPELFFPNSLLSLFAEFGVSCHRFEQKVFYKIKKTSIWMSFLFGGNNRARTCDPLLVRQMLSQLSYAPTHIRRTCDELYNTISQSKSQDFFSTFFNFFICLFAQVIF